MNSPRKQTIPGLHPFHRAARGLLLVLGMASLATGIWGGLLRLPLALPLPVEHANWITLHGPLMVCGFLGTLIGLERAVGLGAWWTFGVPVLTGTGALALVFGVHDDWPRWMLTGGSALFVAVSVRIWILQPALSNVVMALGALAWLMGNLQWIFAGPMEQTVLWWLSFLLLTILGERIELTRFLRPSPWARPVLWTALACLGAGLAIGWTAPRPGGWLTGLALVTITGWLARFDIARHTLRSPGLPRFMAWCLLTGYAWLLVTGLLVAAAWPQTAGFFYDAALHAFFVGFVFSMIFGHAPVIFPAVLGLPIHYRVTSYLPLIVLHLSVLLRVVGNLADWGPGRAWGAAGNGIAIGLFLLHTVGTMILGSLSARGAPAKRAEQP